MKWHLKKQTSLNNAKQLPLLAVIVHRWGQDCIKLNMAEDDLIGQAFWPNRILILFTYVSNTHTPDTHTRHTHTLTHTRHSHQTHTHTHTHVLPISCQLFLLTSVAKHEAPSMWVTDMIPVTQKWCNDSTSITWLASPQVNRGVPQSSGKRD